MLDCCHMAGHVVAGQNSFLSLDYDYGIGDYPLTDAQSAGAYRPILQIPFVLSSTSIFYNITGNPKLKLNPSVLAQVLQGNITTWDDPAIIKLNPTLSYVHQAACLSGHAYMQ